MDKTNTFQNAKSTVEVILANKNLTDNNYSKMNTNKLSKKIWNTIEKYVKENIYVYQNWDKQDYSMRKKFISDILNLLLERFPGNIAPKPKIYFQEEIKSVWPHDIQTPSALFYSPELNPWANDLVKSKLGSTNPFFAFFHDLSGRGLLGQITHEFTHYLQSIGQSSISHDTIKQAADYYQYYYADKKKNKQIYDDSIHEYEARDVGKYIKEQLKQLMTSNSLIFNKNNNYEK